MGRASRFTWGLSSRRSSTAPTSPNSDDYAANAKIAPLPAMDSFNASKVERLLGATNIPRTTPGLNPQVEPASSQQQQTSSDRGTWVAPSRSNGDLRVRFSQTANDSPDHSQFQQLAPVTSPLAIPPTIPETRIVSSRASSNALGDRGWGDGATDQGTTISSMTDRDLYHRDAESISRSHYDSSKLPLVVSQQTSDSAVRDMALWKGRPSVGAMSPQSLDNASQSPSMAGGSFSPVENGHGGKWVDISKLFPQPNPSGGPLLSPTKMVYSPDNLSEVSNYVVRHKSGLGNGPGLAVNAQLGSPPVGSSAASPTMRRDSESLSPKSSNRAVQHRSILQSSGDLTKIHVRRPPPGTKNWFDAFDEDDDLDAGDEGFGGSGQQLESVDELEQLGEVTSNPVGQDLRQLNLLQRSRTAPEYGRQPSLRSVASKNSSMANSNLQDSSILSFSSSSDEDDEEEHHYTGDHHLGASRSNVELRNSFATGASDGAAIPRKASMPPLPRRNFSDISVPAAPGHEPWQSPALDAASCCSTVATGGKFNIILSSPTVSAHPSVRTPRRSRPPRSRPPPLPGQEDGASIRSYSAGMASPTLSTFSSKSEPTHDRLELHRLMAVTDEEWAILDKLRKKRNAAAAKEMQAVADSPDETPDPVTSSRERAEARALLKMHPILTQGHKPRTSGFLTMESPLDEDVPPVPALPTPPPDERQSSSRASPNPQQQEEDQPRQNPPALTVTSVDIPKSHTKHDHVTSAIDSPSDKSAILPSIAQRGADRKLAPISVPAEDDPGNEQSSEAVDKPGQPRSKRFDSVQQSSGSNGRETPDDWPLASPSTRPSVSSTNQSDEDDSAHEEEDADADTSGIDPSSNSVKAVPEANRAASHSPPSSAPSRSSSTSTGVLDDPDEQIEPSKGKVRQMPIDPRSRSTTSLPPPDESPVLRPLSALVDESRTAIAVPATVVRPSTAGSTRSRSYSASASASASAPTPITPNTKDTFTRYSFAPAIPERSSSKGNPQVPAIPPQLLQYVNRTTSREGSRASVAGSAANLGRANSGRSTVSLGSNNGTGSRRVSRNVVCGSSVGGAAGSSSKKGAGGAHSHTTAAGPGVARARTSTRCSVSQDVLAAWGSLGGAVGS